MLNKVPLSANIYIGLVALFALGLLGYTLTHVGLISLNRFLLSGMLLVMGVAAAWHPLSFGHKSKVRLTTSVGYAAVLLLPPALAILVAGGSILISDGWQRHKHDWDEIALNTAMPMVKVGLAALFLVAMGWNEAQPQFQRIDQIVALIGAAMIIYVVGSLLIGIIVALHTGQPLVHTWWEGVFKLDRTETLTYLAQFGLGLLAAIVANAEVWALVLLCLPALAVYSALDHQAQLRERVEKRLTHQAFHDALTDLPNRTLLLDRLAHHLRTSPAHNGLLAVLFLDLDRFKHVNDSLGHEAGDQLLQAVAQRLQRCVRPQDTVARLGGDEFTILLPDIKEVAMVTTVAQRIIEVLEMPFVIDDHQAYIGTSIGIALSHTGQGTAGDLLNQADLAMYEAKHAGKGRFVFFDPAMDVDALERLDLEHDLRRALEQHEFQVYYQPQVELATDKLIGWEALVRWQHPQRGLVPPSEFIPLAQETGLIVPIDDWVLDQACRQAVRWLALCHGTAPPTMYVNLSAQQLKQENFVAKVARVLTLTGLQPQYLGFEIMEQMLVDDVETKLEVLHKLKHLGVRLAIDNFGIGLGSLRNLKRSPADLVKLDHSFIDESAHNTQDREILQGLLNLATSMGFQTLAKGVETAEQHSVLVSLGCAQGQGHFFAPPKPQHQAEALITTPSIRQR